LKEFQHDNRLTGFLWCCKINQKWYYLWIIKVRIYEKIENTPTFYHFTDVGDEQLPHDREKRIHLQVHRKELRNTDNPLYKPDVRQ